MLTEERLQGIWRIVTEKGSASIQELMDALNISESTKTFYRFGSNDCFRRRLQLAAKNKCCISCL